MPIRAGDLTLTDRDLATLGAAFGVADLEAIGGFENALFRSGDGHVLRVTHASRRSAELIRAECEFMEHLGTAGVPVVGIREARDGEPVVATSTEAGEGVLVVCMTEARGAPKPPAAWTADEVVSYGELLGSMHRAAASPMNLPSGARRPGWTDPIFDVGLDHSRDPELVARHRELQTAARNSPAGAESLLIHQDAHPSNIFVTDAGELTIFDFDDSAYGTAVHDVAIVLFYWAFSAEPPVETSVRSFVDRFVEGYERHATLAVNWAVDADHFLSHRELEIYWLLTTEDVDSLSPREARFIQDRRPRLLGGVPYLGRPLVDIVS